MSLIVRAFKVAQVVGVCVSQPVVASLRKLSGRDTTGPPRPSSAIIIKRFDSMPVDNTDQALVPDQSATTRTKTAVNHLAISLAPRESSTQKTLLVTTSSQISKGNVQSAPAKSTITTAPSKQSSAKGGCGKKKLTIAQQREKAQLLEQVCMSTFFKEKCTTSESDSDAKTSSLPIKKSKINETQVPYPAYEDGLRMYAEQAVYKANSWLKKPAVRQKTGGKVRPAAPSQIHEMHKPYNQPVKKVVQKVVKKPKVVKNVVKTDGKTQKMITEMQQMYRK